MAESFSVKTFGCKVNTYDSGLLQKKLQQSGFQSTNKEEDIHIVNTCAVTAEATREAIRHIRRTKKKYPNKKIVVTGCAAQVDTEKINIPEADLIIANSHKSDFAELLLKSSELGTEKLFHSNIFKKDEYDFGGGEESEHTRSFLKIQDGCNSFCTYCVIPFARGKSRSIPIHKLVQKANELYEQGVREIVLTGVHIADYASFKDEGISTVAAARSKTSDKLYYLEDLVEALLKYTKIPRFRLSSLEPGELSDRLLEMYKDDRLCPHFHMSIQSACSDVLFNMKRKYSARSVQESLNKISLNVSNAYVGMDIIVGFPGESSKQFDETYKTLSDLDWTKIHVFPYSDRPGTKAAEYDNKIFHPELGRRAKALRELSDRRLGLKASQQIGTEKKLLLLKNKDPNTDYLIGLSRDYWQIKVPKNSENLKKQKRQQEVIAIVSKENFFNLTNV